MEEAHLGAITKIGGSLYQSLGSRIAFIERKADRIVLLLIVAYTVFFSGYTIFMHYAFKTYAWDLGIFTQSMWSTINLGRPFYYTIEAAANPSMNFIGAHFSPVLLLVVPIYALYQSPLTLLVLQSFVIGLAALPLYWIAERKLQSKLWGLTFAVAFLLHPALHGMNCFDFHVEAFIPLFFFLAFHYLDTKQWVKGFAFSILTLTTIEFAPILTAFLGLYFLAKTGQRRTKTSIRPYLRRIFPSILLITTSIFWLCLAFSVTYSINPLKATGLPGKWDNWGRSLSEVLLNVLKDPLKALSTMATPIEKTFYAFFILAPVAFLPLLAPLEFLLSLPWIFAALLSDYSPYYEPYFQYFGFVVAQTFIAAVFGARRLVGKITERKGHQSLEKKLMALVLVLSITFTVAASPVGLPALTRKNVQITPHTNTLHSILALIPPNVSVATQNDILPHLAQREQIQVLDWPMEQEFDYILIDLKSPHIYYKPTPTSVPPIEALNGVFDQGYGIVASADGILLLRKNYTGPHEIYEPYSEIFDHTKLFTMPFASYVGYDGSSESGSVIIHSNEHRTGWMWAGPLQWFLSGRYNVTFRMKTESSDLNLTMDVLGTRLNMTNNTWSYHELDHKTLGSSDFESIGSWQEFTVSFTVNEPMQVELRGWCESSNTYVALDYIRIMQLEP